MTNSDCARRSHRRAGHPIRPRRPPREFAGARAGQASGAREPGGDGGLCWTWDSPPAASSPASSRKTAEQVAVVLVPELAERPRLLRRGTARREQPGVVDEPPGAVDGPGAGAVVRAAGAHALTNRPSGASARACRPPPSPQPTRPPRTSRCAGLVAVVGRPRRRTGPPRRSRSTPRSTRSPTDKAADGRHRGRPGGRRVQRGQYARGAAAVARGGVAGVAARATAPRRTPTPTTMPRTTTPTRPTTPTRVPRSRARAPTRATTRPGPRAVGVAAAVGRGSGDDASADDESDPPNTVVKVRAPRERPDDVDGDGVQSVRGSTRLEAKRQRRRDGRDAGRRRVPILSEAEFLARRESVERSMVVRERGDRVEIGVLEDDVLVEHFVTSGPRLGSATNSLVGNIYLGRVQNVLPSMEAAFVDIGRGRNAVLYAARSTGTPPGSAAVRAASSRRCPAATACSCRSPRTRSGTRAPA